jgi:hypothetical protein
MRVDASEKRMRRDGCFKLAAVRFNRMQLVFIHCCLLFEQSLAWNCRMRFLLFPVPRQELPINAQRTADIARIIFHVDGGR